MLKKQGQIVNIDEDSTAENIDEIIDIIENCVVENINESPVLSDTEGNTGDEGVRNGNRDGKEEESKEKIEESMAERNKVRERGGEEKREKEQESDLLIVIDPRSHLEVADYPKHR